MEKSKRVLGIDPGSRIVGYGIIEENHRKLVSLAYGTFDVRHLFFQDRLKEIYKKVEELILTFHPEETAVETIFFAKNASSSIKLGQAKGAIMTAIGNQNLWIHEYSPTQVKQAVCGYGSATKVEVQKMVLLLLGIHQQIKKDASDALALAICHLNSIRLQEAIKPYDRILAR